MSASSFQTHSIVYLREMVILFQADPVPGVHAIVHFCPSLNLSPGPGLVGTTVARGALLNWK